VRIAGSPFQLLFHQHLAARPRDLVQSFPCCCHPPPSLSSAFHESPPFFFSPRVLTLKVRAVGNPWLRRESILGAGLCTSVIRRHSHTTLKGSLPSCNSRLGYESKRKNQRVFGFDNHESLYREWEEAGGGDRGSNGRHKNFPKKRGKVFGHKKHSCQDLVIIKSMTHRNPSFRLLASRKGNTKILPMDF
jgi:hypothetical protein